MAPTSNPVRKLNKKIRESKKKGQHEKAELLQQELDHILKCQAINEKNKKLKEKKKNKNKLTDDMFMEQYQKENAKLFTETDEELKLKEREQKKKSIENKVKRAKILQAKKEKEEQKQEIMNQLKVGKELYKKKGKELDKRLEEHEVFMKVEKSEELDKVYDKVMDEIKNKKLANRTYKKELKQRSMMIEVAIQGYMDQHKVSYEEAQAFIYNNIREQNDSKKEECKSRTLMIDGTAKL